MTLDQIALIAEIAAALAIFISLIFVGIQLRDNTNATRMGTAAEAAKSLEDIYAIMGSSTETSDVLTRGLMDPDTLNAAERVQYISLCMAFFLAQQHYFYAAKSRLLDEEIKKTLMMPIRGLADRPGLHMYWQHRRGYFRPEFQAEVDRVLAEGAGTYGDYWQETGQNIT